MIPGRKLAVFFYREGDQMEKCKTTSTKSLTEIHAHKNVLEKGRLPQVSQHNTCAVLQNPTSYKAIHYERQTQLKYKHRFNLNPFFTILPHWLKKAPRSRNLSQRFTLRFDFTLPGRRKIKRGSLVHDLTSVKEFEAAQTGLACARSMFDIFADELYNCNGYIFGKGLQIGPSRIDNGKIKTCIIFSIPAVSELYRDMGVADILAFSTEAIFSADELNHMQAVAATMYFNDDLLGSMEINPEPISFNSLETARKYYGHETIQDVLYHRVEGRNVLYAFEHEGVHRQGMMVETDTGWKQVTIQNRDDLYRSVEDFGVIEFIPAVNRIEEEYPSIITIETDPGFMFTTVLGKKKSWIFNTYVTEKICRILDTYRILYVVKFSGNKGWHIQIPVELEEPLRTYQMVVEAIVNRELSDLPEEEQVAAMIANFVQLEDVKSYTDPFFVARRLVDLIGACVMFFELKDIDTVLTLQDMRKLCLRVKPAHKRDYKNGEDILETQVGPVKVEIPQVLSINPYSKFRRQFKLLIDHSSNKREGKLRSILSLHSKSGLVSIPALMYKEKGYNRFDEKMWDYNSVCRLATPEEVHRQIDGKTDEYPLVDLVKKWEMNKDLTGFEQFLADHKGLLIYLLQNGGEALELLDTKTARWVNANLWDKIVAGNNPLHS